MENRYFENPLKKPKEYSAGPEQALLQEQIKNLLHSRSVELVESEVRFKAIFENAPIGFVIFDRQLVIVCANPKLEAFLGYGRGELVGKHIKDLYLEEDCAEAAKHAGQLDCGDADAFRLERRYRRKDGTLAWGWLVCSVLRDEGGGHSGYLAMIEDIGERKSRSA
ncbi:MAG TPA: PAS domain S-box protein [Nitrospirota bacterium]